MSTHRTVLVIADSDASNNDYRQQLQQDGDVAYKILTEHYNTPIPILSQFRQIDGILLELSLPYSNSIRLLRQLKEQMGDHCPPIVVVDGGDTEIAVQAFKNGAVDYLVRDRISPDDLRLAMQSAIENAELRRKLQYSQEQFQTSVENMLDCFGIFSAMRNQTGQIVDFRIDYLNAAAYENNQMPKAMQLGRGLCEILPAHRETGLFDEYCRVVETGEPLIKDSLLYDDTYGNQRLIRAYDIRATKLNDGFVASWRDVTDRKQMELDLNRTVAALQTSQQHQRDLADAIGNPVKMTGVDMDISERKQVEAALQTSEKRFRDMADHAPVMIWATDPTGYCTYLNQGWYNFTGQTEETGLGFGWLDAVHPEDSKSSKDVFLKANEQREAFRLEYRLRRRDGVYCWAIDAANPWFGEDGEFKGYIGSVIDISNRKQAEEALAVNEARLRGFVDANVIGILYGDIYGNIREANDELLRIVGYAREDLQAGRLRWVDITPPEYLSLDEQGIAEARANGACTPYEKEYIRKDGSRVPVLIGYSLVGEIREDTVVFVLDLSDRKQAEAALRRSEERYRTLFETIDEGFCVIEMLFDQHNKPIDYRFLEVNPAFEKQTGLTNARGKLMRELVPNHEEHWFEIYGEVARTGKPSRFESRAAAMHRWYDVYAFRIEQPESHKVAVLFNDITDRKQVEEEQEKLLTEEQAAREAAERANRIKDEFLAVLSHELRSPLNPILGWTKLLQMHQFDKTKTAEALATIERNAKLQTQLIDDLLDVAKILRGKLSLNMTSVNLAFVIEAAIETVRTAAAAKSISLHPVLSNIGQVSGDAARLQQVVWNLLSNAIKFTTSGGRVEIQLDRVDNQAEIMVRDTGRGISPDFLPHIFESFRQEDASITRKYGGLGLGLAIVRQLVETHGGTIRADSPGEGLGATFTVRLPLLSIEPVIKQTDELPQQELDLTGIRILAVDDDPDARELLTVLLTQYGAEVLTVASAAEVLASLTSFQPDVLVSDIGMPGVDGYTLIQQVRALPATQGGQIPAIALTAYARESDHQRSITSGYQRHVTKPLEPERLVQAVVALT